MDRPAKVSMANALQRRQSSRSGGLSCCNSGGQTRKAVEGTSFLGDLSSLHAAFFSSPSSTSSKNNPCPVSAASSAASSSSQCSGGASASSYTCGKGRRTPCWTFLPVGSLEAKKKKRGGLPATSKISTANAPVPSVVPSCRETLPIAGSDNEGGQVSLSSGEQASQSPSLFRPPTFERLLCLSTDEEKDDDSDGAATSAGAAAATVSSSESKKPLSAVSSVKQLLSQMPASASESRGKKKQLEDDTCFSAPLSPVDSNRKVSTDGSTESSSEGWLSLHVDRADDISKTETQPRHIDERQLAAAKDFNRGSTKKGDMGAAEETKREKSVSRVLGGVRDLHFHTDAFKSSQENVRTARSHHHHRQQPSVQSQEENELRTSVALHQTQRRDSRDVKREGLQSLNEETAKLDEERSFDFTTWMTDTEGNTDSRGDGWESEGSSSDYRVRREKEQSSAQCSRIEREASGQRIHRTPMKQRDENRQARETAAQSREIEEDKAEKVITRTLKPLRRTSLQGRELRTNREANNTVGFLTTARLPSDDTVALVSPPRERTKKDRHSAAAGEQDLTSGSKTRCSSEPCRRREKAAATAARENYSLEGIEAMKKEQQQQYSLEKQETQPRRTPEDREAVRSSRRKTERKEKKTCTGDECERELSNEKREAKTDGSSSDAEEQSGYDGGSSEQERPHERNVKSTKKKHRWSKEEIAADGKRCSSHRRSRHTAVLSESVCPREGGTDRAENPEESVSLTIIPPHPLFIPGLRLSLLKKRRKGRASQSDLQLLPPDGCSKTLAECGSRSSRRVASTCIASQAACGIFGAGTSEEEDGADDGSASVRRERSLLSSLFTLSSTPSPSRKQQLRRTIKRYAVFRLCSDGDTSGKEEEGRDGANSDSQLKEQLGDLYTAPEGGATVEKKTQLCHESQRASTASPSPVSDRTPGKTKPQVRASTSTGEQHSYVSQRHKLRPDRYYRRNGQDKCQRRGSTSSRSNSRSSSRSDDICRLRLPRAAVIAGHFSEDFSSESTLSQVYSAAERLYSPLEPVSDLKKPHPHCTGNIGSNTKRRPSQTASCAVRTRAGESALSPRSSADDDAEEVCPPSSSKETTSVLAAGKTVSRAARTARSPAYDGDLSPTPTHSRDMNEELNTNYSSTSPVQTKTKFLRRPPGKRKECRQKRYPSSYYSCSSTSSFTLSEEQPLSQRRHHEEHTRWRKSPERKLQVIESVHRQVIARSSSRATHPLADERRMPRRNRSVEVPAAVSSRGDIVETISSSSEEKISTASTSPSCGSAVSSPNTAPYVTVDRSKGTRANSDPHGRTRKSGSVSQQQHHSRVNISNPKGRDSKGVCVLPNVKRRRERNQEKKREQRTQEEDGEINEEEAWEDLGGPSYKKTEIKEKKRDPPVEHASAVLVKTKPIIRNDKHRTKPTIRSNNHINTDDGRAGCVQMVAPRLIQDGVPLSKMPDPSEQQPNCSSANAAPQHGPSGPIQELEGLPCPSGDSGGFSEAEIPSAFDTIWEGSFRGVVHPEGYFPTASSGLNSDCALEADSLLPAATRISAGVPYYAADHPVSMQRK